MQRLSDNTLQTNTEEEQGGDLLKLLSPYLIQWKWFLLSVVLLIVVGILSIQLMTPMYRASASLMIKDRQAGRSMMIEELDLFSTRSVVDNEIDILQSYILMERVVNDLELQITYSVKRGGHHNILYKESPLKVELITPSEISYKEPLCCRFTDEGQLTINGEQYHPNGLIVTDYGTLRLTVNDSLLTLWNKEEALFVQLNTVYGAVNNLLKHLSVSCKNKASSVLSISIVTPNPRMSVEVINHLIDVYTDAAVENKNLLISSTLQFIDNRLLDVAGDLNQTEAELEQYKMSHGITSISAESQMYLSLTQANDVERSKINVQLSVLQEIENYVLRKENSPGTAPATWGVNDPTLLNLIASLIAVEGERSTALRTMKAANPVIQTYDNRIASLKASILDNIRTLRSSLKTTQQELQAQNRKLEQQINAIPKKERELLDVTRQHDVRNQLYVYLLSKREETAISYASTIADSRLIDPARITNTNASGVPLPVSPRKRVILLIFALVGLLVPVIIIYVRELVYNKIVSKDEMEKGLQVPLVGDIAFVKTASKIVAGVKRGRLAEQFRTLRSNLNFMMAAGQGFRTIMTTSSVSGEGKSFLAANLGVTYASLGKRTVVLGFDLRHPGLNLIFGVENNVGLSNYLAGQCSLQEITQPIEGHDNIYVISCGDIPPNPQELLISPKATELFAELRERYDYVIIDTPPAGLLSDALLLNDFADVVVYVMRQNYTPKDRIKLVNDFHLHKKLNNLCVVANGIKSDQWLGYHYGGYYGYYGRYGGYYYHGDDESSTLRPRKWWKRIIHKYNKRKS